MGEKGFTIPRKDFLPAYRKLFEEEGKSVFLERVEKGLELLSPCRVCPHRCGVDRKKRGRGICQVGRYAVVSSAFPHHGEENCLRGWKGSGTIFFSGCNLRCVFCQNYDISWYVRGEEVYPEDLANIMIYLQNLGVHNINLVTPSHVVPQILESIPIAIEKGLNIPIVYNSGGYDSVEALKLLDGIVDIYMPDFKFWGDEVGGKYTSARDYGSVAREAIREMHRQVGDLVFDENGLALRGLLVRHLVMPNNIADTYNIMKWLHDEISPHTYVNIMAQYYPTHLAYKFPELSRSITVKEYMEALEDAIRAGIYRFDQR